MANTRAITGKTNKTASKSTGNTRAIANTVKGAAIEGSSEAISSAIKYKTTNAQKAQAAKPVPFATKSATPISNEPMYKQAKRAQQKYDKATKGTWI